MSTAIKARKVVANIGTFISLVVLGLIGYVQWNGGIEVSSGISSFICTYVIISIATFAWMAADYNVYRVEKKLRGKTEELSSWSTESINIKLNTYGIGIDRVITFNNTMIVCKATFERRKKTCFIIRDPKIKLNIPIRCTYQENGYTIIVCDNLSDRKVRKIMRKMGQ